MVKKMSNPIRKKLNLDLNQPAEELLEEMKLENEAYRLQDEIKAQSLKENAKSARNARIADLKNEIESLKNQLES